MPLAICQVQLPYDTGLPEDVAINTFYVAGAPPAEDIAATVNPLLSDFYTALAGYLSGYINPSLTHVTYYDIADPSPRVPIADLPLTITGLGDGVSLPLEVALCLSYRGDAPSGVPAGRRRGRLYIGPFDDSALDNTLPGRPKTALINTLGDAAADFLDAVAAEDLTWVMFSKTNETPYPIIGGWVDNSFDTQRRRGIDATARALWNPGIIP